MPHTMKATGKERKALIFWSGVCDSLVEDGKALENRIRSCSPTAWRDWRLCTSIMERLWNQLCQTLEVPDRQWMQRTLSNQEVIVRQKGPFRSTDYVVMDAQYANALILHAMHNECSMCLKEDGDMRRCELRKAIQWVAPLPDQTGKPTGFCEYSNFDWEGISVDKPIPKPDKE